MMVSMMKLEMTLHLHVTMSKLWCRRAEDGGE